MIVIIIIITLRSFERINADRRKLGFFHDADFRPPRQPLRAGAQKNVIEQARIATISGSIQTNATIS